MIITMVDHDPEDRQADGRWEGTIIQKKVPVREIKWKGLYDKNNDVQYSPRQLIQKSHYEELFRATEEDRVSKFRKLLDCTKEGTMKK